MKVLAYRFSAFGDVALVVPAIRSIVNSNKGVEITFVSRKIFQPLFHDIPGLNFYGIELNEYKGLGGLRRLYKELKSLDTWDHVLDLHGVMRTWVLNAFFRFDNFSVFSVDKGRNEKKLLTRKKNKVRTPLKHSVQRTLDVFEAAGLSAVQNNELAIRSSKEYDSMLQTYLSSRNIHKTTPWIAVAPFSVHRQKEWPIEKVEALIQMLLDKKYYVFLFGAGQMEQAKLDKIEKGKENVFNLAGNLELGAEILLLKQIDVMVSMDSFNMHLASLSGVKVVSIWAATHSAAGFGPLNNNEQFIVQRDDLPCRPCSVFGNKPCYRGDLACLDIDENKVLQMIDRAMGTIS